jgi:hypothetical protein
MKLKALKAVSNPAQLSMIRSTTELFFKFDAVNAALMEASFKLKDSPKLAYFRAPVSFVPSPTIPTILPLF